MDKKSLGINGIHNNLGLEVTNAEFRGYVIAKLEEITTQQKEIKATTDSQSGRITVLEKGRAGDLGFIAGVSAVAGIAITLFFKLINF